MKNKDLPPGPQFVARCDTMVSVTFAAIFFFIINTVLKNTKGYGKF